MGVATHARTSNTWNSDKHTLGCHGGGGQTDHTRFGDTGGGRDTPLVRVIEGEGPTSVSTYFLILLTLLLSQSFTDTREGVCIT